MGGKTQVAHEMAHCACVRFGSHGTRQMICVKTLEFLRAVGAGTTASVSEAAEKLKSVSADDVFFKDFHKQYPIQCATIGANDAFYLPAGWLFYETVGSDDFAGMRIPIFSSSDVGVLEEIDRHLTKPSPALVRVVMALSSV